MSSTRLSLAAVYVLSLVLGALAPCWPDAAQAGETTFRAAAQAAALAHGSHAGHGREHPAPEAPKAPTGDCGFEAAMRPAVAALAGADAPAGGPAPLLAAAFPAARIGRTEAAPLPPPPEIRAQAFAAFHARTGRLIL